VLAEYALRLWEGRVPLEELTITKTISKKPEEYRHDTLSALAAKQLARKGIAVHPGEAVRYVIQRDGVADKAARVRPLELLGDDAGYDAAKYVDLLVRAAETVLNPCGYDAARLHRYLAMIRSSPPSPPPSPPSGAREFHNLSLSLSEGEGEGEGA